MVKQNLRNNKNTLYEERNYKDTVFRMLFRNKRRLLKLYNAINGTSYDNPDELEIVTLENAIYMSMKNDIGFIIDSQLHLYEHQSTINPNMPLRFLYYIAKEYEKIINSKELYREKQITIPVPKFVVFYNGTKQQPERRILKLSDAYSNMEGEPQLELIVEVLNLNDGYNEDIKEQCRDLKEYMQYVNCVREEAADKPLNEAVPIAVDKCINKGILKEFLVANKVEVVAMSIFEYDEEGVKELWRRDAFEDGLEQGRLEILMTLVNQGLLEIKDAATQANMSVEEFQQRMQEKE